MWKERTNSINLSSDCGACTVEHIHAHTRAQGHTHTDTDVDTHTSNINKHSSKIKQKRIGVTEGMKVMKRQKNFPRRVTTGQVSKNK